MHAVFKSDKMCDFVGMPNKCTPVDRTGDVEWPSPSRVGVPRWDSHLPQSFWAKTCFSCLVLISTLDSCRTNIQQILSSQCQYQGYYVLTQKVYDFVLGYMSRNEELET